MIFQKRGLGASLCSNRTSGGNSAKLRSNVLSSNACEKGFRSAGLHNQPCIPVAFKRLGLVNAYADTISAVILFIGFIYIIIGIDRNLESTIRLKASSRNLERR